MSKDSIVDFIKPLEQEHHFRFSCHAHLDCFTHCCRMLELALTPYDLLRIRLATGLSSQEVLDRYVIVEQDRGEPFPRLYLTMVDDGQASCVFVKKNGCAIYPHRPGACRTYPLGRGVRCHANGETTVHHVLITEPHCHGFGEEVMLNIDRYTEKQGLAMYHRSNDRLAAILQHHVIRGGFMPNTKQIELYILALYNLDVFRSRIQEGLLDQYQSAPIAGAVPGDDEKLLDLGMDFISRILFDPPERG